MKRNVAVSFLMGLVSFVSVSAGAADSGLTVNANLSELKVAHYGQRECDGGQCPNVEVSIVPPVDGQKEDTLNITLDIQPADCNGGFVFKNAVSEYIEFGSDDSIIYRYFDSISRNGPASPCMGVAPRPLNLTMPIRMSIDRTRIRFVQSNGKYTEVSYKAVREGRIKKAKDLKIENNK